jgi:hypothetical protein
MTIVSSICLWGWMVVAWLQVTLAPQREKPSNPVFENGDFKIVKFSDVWDPKSEYQPFSGLLVFWGRTESPKPADDVWKFSRPGNGTEIVWANSPKTEHLTAVYAGRPGYVVVPKSGEKLNMKMFDSRWPAPFAESLRDDIFTIATLVEASEHGVSPDKKQQDRAHAGLQDLLFKNTWVSSNNLAGVLPNPLVDVTARTLDQSGTVIQNCTVWYVPIAWEDDRQHWKRFDRFSSPTSQSIAVGQYKMWADHNGKEGERVSVNPGDDQKPAKAVDLGVP